MAEKFDINAYIKKNSSPETEAPKKGESKTFNVDSYIEKNTVSVPESFVRGAAQGLSLGFADEAAGVIGGVKAKLKGGEYGPAYKKARDEERILNQAAESQNPVAYRVGDFGSALIPGFGAIGKVKSVGGKIAQAVGLGALQGVGRSEKEDAAGIAGEGIVGGAVGGISQGAASALGGVARGLAPESLKKKSAEWATKAIGNEVERTNKIVNKSGGAQKVGEGLRELGIVGGAPKSKAEMLERASQIVKEEGEKIGQIYKDLDEQFLQANPALYRKITQKSTAKAIEKVENEVLKPLEKSAAKAPIAEKIRSMFLDRFKQNSSSGELGFAGIHQEIRDLDEIAYDLKKLDKPLHEELQKVSGILRSQLRNEGQKVNPATAKLLAETNQKFAVAKTAQNVLKDKVNRDAKNRSVSLTDTITGSAAGGGALAAFGNSVEGILKSLATAVGAGAVHKGARTYGPEIASNTYDAAARLMANDPGFVQKFGRVLGTAADSGAASVAATHAALLKDPEYREAIEAERRRMEEYRNKTMDRRKQLGEPTEGQ